MRERLLKIVTAASLLLGLLGPQVASGQQPVAEPSISNTNSTELVVVSDVAVQQIVPQDLVLSDCGPLNSFLDRMDILIWQACGTVSVTDEFDLPTLAVTEQPSFVPAVAVQTDTVRFAAQETLNETETSSEVGLIPQGLVSESKVQLGSVLHRTTSIVSTYSYIEDSQNFNTTVSMRC